MGISEVLHQEGLGMDVRKMTDGRAGFTLTEVMIASGLMMILSLAIFESVLFCSRLAYDIKSRLAADAIAWDAAWDLFNNPLTWFKTAGYSEINSDIDGMPLDAFAFEVCEDPDAYSAWGDRTEDVRVVRQVLPNGAPATNWTIRVKVQWPSLSGGAVGEMSNQVLRARINRN